jgi:hypothetical protein
MWYQSYWREPSNLVRSWLVFNDLYVLPLTGDIDWNPAADQQALARVWRDGQKKECA